MLEFWKHASCLRLAGDDVGKCFKRYHLTDSFLDAFLSNNSKKNNVNPVVTAKINNDVDGNLRVICW